MPFIMPRLKDLLPEKHTVAERVTFLPIGGQRIDVAEKTIAQDIGEFVQHKLHPLIETHISQLVRYSFEVYGPRDGHDWDVAMDEDVAAELRDICFHIGFRPFAEVSLGVRIDEPGRDTEVAKALSELCWGAWADQFPTPRHLLDMIGVTRDEVRDLMKPELYVGTKLKPEPVTSVELHQAFGLLRQAIDFSAQEICERIQLSRSSFQNYSTGKSPPHLTPSQSRILAAECDRRAALLAEAAIVFGSVTK